MLRSGETSFEYERPEQPHPKLGAFIGRLEAMLEGGLTIGSTASFASLALCKRPSFPLRPIRRIAIGRSKTPRMAAVLTHSLYEHLAAFTLLGGELRDGLDQLG